MALENYKQNTYDLILLDINMPELDGLSFIQEVKKINKPLLPPILVLTGLRDQTICNQALESGATDFIYKPFNFSEAINRIKNLLSAHINKKRLIELNENLEQTVVARTQQLMDTKLKVIQHLGYAAEYRDTETASHTIRVGEYSRLLGQQLGLDNKTIELLHRAAPLHDIGKIGIPDAILLKPARLEADEWKTMQDHSIIGAQILEDDDDPLIVMARTIALTHHEKFNGQGYPDGLTGEDIPIVGRIVMLADVYDALSMVRPYKEAWTNDKIIELIKKESGTSFDPHIVEIFLSLVDEFSEIRQKLID